MKQDQLNIMNKNLKETNKPIINKLIKEKKFIGLIQ
jgi:hypothetical protein